MNQQDKCEENSVLFIPVEMIVKFEEAATEMNHMFLTGEKLNSSPNPARSVATGDAKR